MRRDLQAAPSLPVAGASLRTRPASLKLPALPALSFGLSRLELGLLGAFAAVSVWVLSLDLWQVVVNGRVWTGTDGLYVTDQMQYLAWIEAASRHLLVQNLFVLHGTRSDYFQPAIAISGVLTAAGLAPALALLLWKPVAVVGLFWAVRAYARAALPRAGAGPRAAVIALALFYGSFTVVYGQFGVMGELFPGFLSWGYPFALMAVAALIGALLTYASARAAGRFSWTPALLGALASLLHPWQGELLVLILIGTELRLSRRPDPARLRLLGATLALTGLPLLYYVLLGKIDLSWSLGQGASKHGYLGSTIALALAPLLAVALLGLLRVGRGFVALTARVWPLAALVVYFQSGTMGATPLHALDGITVPLAVMAVDGALRAGWRRLPARRALTGALLGLACIPATIYELASARSTTRPTPGNPNFITRDERAALTFLRHDPTPGGVLSRFYLGATVPARTGRHTFVGDCIWSEPGCQQRESQAQQLLYGKLTAAQARQFVLATGARFVLSDCQADSDLSQDLKPLLQTVYRFGCATVYELSG